MVFHLAARQSVTAVRVLVVFLIAAGVAGASTLTPRAFGRSASALYRCDRLVSLASLKTVIGLRAVPRAANARVGASVTCTFTFLPPRPFPVNGKLEITVSSHPADSAKIAREYAGQFRSLRGLGNRVYTTVSQTAQISVFAIGHGFVLDLESSDPRVSEYMDLTIAQAVYASAAR